MRSPWSKARLRTWVVAEQSLGGSPPSELTVVWANLETYLEQAKFEKSV